MSSDRVQTLELIDNVCDQFESLLVSGEDVNIADWIKLVGTETRAELYFELLSLEVHYREPMRSANCIGDYFRRFPEFANQTAKVFANIKAEELDESATKLPATVAPVVAGDQVGRFRIISLLGAGGFSSVFLAHDPEINQAVALKIVNPEKASVTPRDFECIVNEANVLSRIDHPAIPRIYDVGEDEFGNPWVSMEFIKGDSLCKKLASDELSTVEVLKVIAKTAMAINEVHQAGFAHRDIKPDNIIVGLDGEPRILDYGLALHEDIQRNRSGERAGTTAFMSPEQVRGQCENLDGRTDIWSLGVTLYLVIAKRLPFAGDTKDEIRKNILSQPVRPPRQIKNNVATIQLEEVCFKALKKDPEDRFPTAGDFGRALQNAIDVLPAEFVLRETARVRHLTLNERSTVLLAQQARAWKAEPVSSNLPGPLRYLQYRFRTNRNHWTESETGLMASASRRIVRIAALLGTIVILLAATRYHFLLREREARIRDLVMEIDATPIGDVRSRFRQLSAFAPEQCLEEIRKRYGKGSEGNSARELLRYAVILAPDIPNSRNLFENSLIEAQADEIETLVELAWPTQEKQEVPKLGNQMRRRLNNVLSTSTYVPGLESIWQDPPDRLHDLFEICGGELTHRYAWCLKMELEEFLEVSDAMRAYRYCPVCVRPWVTHDDTRFVSAIWHRSSADWKMEFDLSPSEFMELNAREPMNLVDVGEEFHHDNDSASLVAIWSSHRSPYGKAKHMLLAEKKPQLVDPDWRTDDPDYCVVGKDIDVFYLEDTPLLVDVLLHRNVRYQPSAPRERKKIQVGSMIMSSFPRGQELAPGTVAHDERLAAARQLQADAYYALGEFGKSSDKFQRKIDEDATWEDLVTRTLSFARSGDIVKANHSKTLLQRKLMDSVRNRNQLNLTFGVARAIDSAVGAELEFWTTGDSNEFIRWVKRRLQILEKEKSPFKYDRVSEYYALAVASQSVFQAVSLASDDGSRKSAESLEKLTKRLVKASMNTKSGATETAPNWYSRHATLSSPFSSSLYFDQGTSVRSSVFTTHASNFESRFIDTCYDRAHVLKREEIISDNFFPVSVVLGRHNGRNPRKGSVWHREVASKELAQREQRLANSFSFALRHREDLGIWKVLASPRESALKSRIIDSIFRFDVAPSILLDRLDQSAVVPERLSILQALRHYSTNRCTDCSTVEKILQSLDRLKPIASHKETELCRIIRINLQSSGSADTIFAREDHASY